MWSMGTGLLERHAVLQSPSRIEELVKIWIHATKVSEGGSRLDSPCKKAGRGADVGKQMEIGFWEMFPYS